jgi:hypothetical protein
MIDGWDWRMTRRSRITYVYVDAPIPSGAGWRLAEEIEAKVGNT